ncbi:PDZ domain-containing protein [Solihabitans fulvus]|uniref:endopeptidase La n=2 Tax=Solihabitans fulvus TaxID=1892852 RepID=A0A5B2XJ02_9PSEU|nr:PDZ domain-containing protein [Solihabitans fulvus]
MISVLVVAALGLLGGLVKVPYVALGPGPTYDTLGAVGGKTVVQISDQQPFPTTGHLTMTTVSLTDEVTLFGALGLWASGRYALAPREEYYKPGQSEQQVQQDNVKAFQDSQTNAEVAALRYLGYQLKVTADQIVKGSPADNTIEPGDRLVSVNGKTFGNSDEMREVLKATKPGDKVAVTFQHDKQEPRTAEITLGKSDDRTWGFLGVSPIDQADVKFKVTITLPDVGGPSAGLMFALAIIDKLTPDNINGGQSVAGTGEIDPAGNVKPIGGIPFKMMAARDGGATVFLVPTANCEEAKQKAPDGLRLIKVDKLADAVSSLKAMKDNKDTPHC